MIFLLYAGAVLLILGTLFKYLFRGRAKRYFDNKTNDYFVASIACYISSIVFLLVWLAIQAIEKFL